MKRREELRLLALLLLAAMMPLTLQARQSATSGLPSYEKASSAPLATSNPFVPSPAAAQGGLPACPHLCLLVPDGESVQDAMDQFERNNHCSIDAGAGDEDEACTEKWREDESFLRESEGALVKDGYVPVYSKDVKDKSGKVIHKKGDPIASSGVTISTGVDLGQQSESGTRSLIDKYIQDKGNPDNVDVDALMKKLSPYFGPKKRGQAGIDELAKNPLSVTDDEAGLLEKAFGYDTQTRVAKQFDKKNTEKMVFKKLPEEAQTIIFDFSYQYGTSDSRGSIRTTFWDYVYKGAWKDLADWLTGQPDSYKTRRKREGDRLQAGIDSSGLPESGDPCSASTGGGSSASGDAG